VTFTKFLNMVRLWFLWFSWETKLFISHSLGDGHSVSMFKSNGQKTPSEKEKCQSELSPQ